MFRTLVVAAIVGYAAYHYGVDTGRQEARLHHRAAVTDNSQSPVLDSSGNPVVVSPHHHRQTPDADGAKLAADSRRLAVTVQKKAQELVIHAQNAIPDPVKEKSASLLDGAVHSIEKSLKGHRDDEWEGRGEGRSI